MFCEGDFGGESFLTAEVADEYTKMYQTKNFLKWLIKSLEVIYEV